MREPLTEAELKEMIGEPVYCPELDVYGIIKYETVGRWAGILFLLGTWHNNGAAVNFEYNILDSELKCYKIDTEFVDDSI